jgi:hypothetical protein
MLEYRKRVISERDDIEEKRKKLSDFIFSKEGQSLDSLDLGRLIAQFHIMGAYSRILSERIEYFLA